MDKKAHNSLWTKRHIIKKYTYKQNKNTKKMYTMTQNKNYYIEIRKSIEKPE
jgi:hypothetical protein